MSTAGGPKLAGIGRTGDSDIVLCIDAHDAGSYPGEPTTNLIPYYSSRNTALVASVFTAEALWTSRADSTDVIAPDGSSTTTKAVTGTTGNSYLYSYMDATLGVTMASSTTYTLSVWAKTTNMGSTTVSLAFQDRGNGSYNTSVKTITTEWQRFSMTITTGSGATSNTLIGWVSPTNSRTFYFWGWQVEQKGYATPYVVSQLLDPSAQGPSARPASVNLMIHGNVGTGTSFYDSSPSKHTITANGDVTHSTAQSKFSGGSIKFDGTGDYLELADSDDWNLGTEDFTFDCWVYPESFANYEALFMQGQTAGNQSMNSLEFTATATLRWLIRNASGTLLDIYNTSTFSANQWYHVAATRQGTYFKLFVNGVLERTSSSISTSLEDYAYPFFIGNRDVGGGPLHGYMDEVRITKGTALWADDFTPPTRRNRSAPVVDLSGSNNGGNFATTAMTDVATYRDGQVIEPIASAVWDFDGTDDYMRGAQPTGQVGSTTAKTYEYWFKMQSFPPQAGVLTMGSDDANNYKWQYVYVGANGYVQFLYGNNSNYNIYGGSAQQVVGAANVWTCLTISIDISRAYDDRLKIYKNGESISVSWNTGGSYPRTAFYDGSDLRLYTGVFNYQSPFSGSTFFDGEIGKISIWKTGLSHDQVKQNFNANRGRFGV